MSTWWMELKKSMDFAEPDYVTDIRAAASHEKLDKDFDTKLESALVANDTCEKSIPPIFVLAEWGAGKTFQLFCYQQKHKTDKPEIEYKTFWGIHSVPEALFHTISPWQRFLVLVLFVAVIVCGAVWLVVPAVSAMQHWSGPFLIFCNTSLMKPTTLGLLIAVLAVFVIPARWRIMYAIVAALTVPLCGKRTVIMDDLERSCLSKEERWLFLTTLWKHNVQYIIPVGHGLLDETEPYWLDTAHKMEAKIIDLPASKDAKFLFLHSIFGTQYKHKSAIPLGHKCEPKDEYEVFPFTYADDWMDYITPRDIIDIHRKHEQILAKYEKPVQGILVVKLVLDVVISKANHIFEDNWSVSAGYIGKSGSIFQPSNIQSIGATKKEKIHDLIGKLFRSMNEEAVMLISNIPLNGTTQDEFVYGRPEDIFEEKMGKPDVRGFF